MSSFKIFDIAGSGMSAQSVRLNAVASNLANADSVSGDPNTVYRARKPVFQAVLEQGMSTNAQSSASVAVTGVTQSQADPEMRYDPGNPLANADGNVWAPNVNIVEEMADMISASRSYQNNVEVLNTSRDMLLNTLKLGSS